MNLVTKKNIYILLLLVICLGTITIRKTYAKFTYNTITSQAANFSFDFDVSSKISQYNVVFVEGASYAMINVDISNSSSSTMYYGIWSSVKEADNKSDVEVSLLNESANGASGNISGSDTKTISILIKNYNTDSIRVKIGVSVSDTSLEDITYSTKQKQVLKLESIPTSSTKYISNKFSKSSSTQVTYGTNGKVYQDRTKGDGLQEDDFGNIRYYGATPKNYIEYNDELWRIIGVFETIDAKGRREKRLKIIRDESIGNLAWDNKTAGIGSSTSANGSNDWTDARLMMLLNPGYDNNPLYNTSSEMIGSLYWNREGNSTTKCWAGASSGKVNCNFSDTGLYESSRSMIEKVKWNLGGYNIQMNLYANQIYDYEKTANYTVTNHAQNWYGYVGLMYPSDYGYATDLSLCASNLINYNSSTNSYACRTKNWLWKDATRYQWTITPYTYANTGTYVVLQTGYINKNENFVVSDYGVWPTLYLKTNTAITKGDGTSSNPYRILRNTSSGANNSLLGGN